MAAAAVDRRRKKREFCKLIFAVAISRHLVSVKVTFYWIEIKLEIKVQVTDNWQKWNATTFAYFVNFAENIWRFNWSKAPTQNGASDLSKYLSLKVRT